MQGPSLPGGPLGPTPPGGPGYPRSPVGPAGDGLGIPGGPVSPGGPTEERHRLKQLSTKEKLDFFSFPCQTCQKSSNK